MFRLVNGGENLPQRATRFSAGFDVFANEDVVIDTGKTEVLGLGIALNHTRMQHIVESSMVMGFEMFQATHYLKLCLRSSLGVKGLILPNGHGVIDLDYRDEIKMIIHNPFGLSRERYPVKRGDKIGQLVLCRHEGWLLPAEYTKDEERNGGFGSTGKEKQ